MLNWKTYTSIMSNPGLYLCLICGQESPGLAFCSEKCRSLAINRAGSVSERSSPTNALSRSVSDFCQLLPLPEATDFGLCISKPGGKKPGPNKPHGVGGGCPDQVPGVSEKASHELKEYEHCFDQTRRRKTQVVRYSIWDTRLWNMITYFLIVHQV